MAATLQLVLRKDRIASDGTSPVYLRIIKHRKVTHISTDIRVQSQQWDGSKAKVKATHPNAARLNAHLSKLMTGYRDNVLEAEQQSLKVSGKDIKSKLSGGEKADFFLIAHDIAARFKNSQKIGSYDRVRSIIKKVSIFSRKDRLLLAEINEAYLLRYSDYCISEWGNKHNTIHKDMRFIRQVFNEAIRHDLISSDKNPFRKMKLKEEKTTKVFLTMREVDQLAATELPPGTKLELFRNMFVFACFAGGLRVSDVLLLRWNNIDDSRITLRIKKTHSQTAFKLPRQALSIAEAYRNSDAEPDCLVFPALPADTRFDDAVALDRAISATTAHINKVLKIVAGRAGINKRISFHSSRHSFAVNALHLGMGIEYVSKAMGHSAIRETQIYAKIANAELDRAMEVFDRH